MGLLKCNVFDVYSCLCRYLRYHYVVRCVPNMGLLKYNVFDVNDTKLLNLPRAWYASFVETM